MGKQYLMDTNAVIDYLDNKLPDKSADFIDGIVQQISVITRMELLSWQNATSKQIKVLQDFINRSVVFGLEENIILKTIELRMKYKIKLPDAIIAATALCYNMTLITRNSEDFQIIKELKIINSWKL